MFKYRRRGNKRRQSQAFKEMSCGSVYTHRLILSVFGSVCGALSAQRDLCVLSLFSVNPSMLGQIPDRICFSLCSWLTTYHLRCSPDVPANPPAPRPSTSEPRRTARSQSNQAAQLRTPLLPDIKRKRERERVINEGPLRL